MATDFIAGAMAGQEAGVNRREFDRGELQGGLKNGHKACTLHFLCI